MLHVSLDQDLGIATLRPDGELTKSDFAAAAAVIDPYLETHGELNGLIVRAEHFPGWDSFASLLAHLKFVRGHHERVARVAFVTDSAIGGIAEKVASHFVSAQIRHFDFDDLDAAKGWIQSRDRGEAS